MSSLSAASPVPYSGTAGTAAPAAGTPPPTIAGLEAQIQAEIKNEQQLAAMSEMMPLMSSGMMGLPGLGVGVGPAAPGGAALPSAPGAGLMGMSPVFGGLFASQPSWLQNAPASTGALSAQMIADTIGSAEDGSDSSGTPSSSTG
jgi:hypothetical protein